MAIVRTTQGEIRSTGNTGPVQKERTVAKGRKGNPTKKGGIFGKVRNKKL